MTGRSRIFSSGLCAIIPAQPRIAPFWIAVGAIRRCAPIAPYNDTPPSIEISAPVT
jgi:hypothetical protein